MRDRDVVDHVLREGSADTQVPADLEARMRQQFIGFHARLGARRRPLRELAASLAGGGTLRWAAAGVVLATVLAVIFLAGGTDGGRVYAAAVSRLAEARSLQYTMELTPFVSVEFSHLAPAQERIVTSWGIEVRTDRSGAQLVLLHGSKQYVREQKRPEALLRTADLIEQLTSLPRTADSMLGERRVRNRRFVGYRVMGARMPGSHGLDSLDLWIDAESGLLDHVDLAPAHASASGYRMHIRDIRLDASLDPALFDLTPPAGYSEAGSAAAAQPTPHAGASLRPKIANAEQQSAIVIPMSGSYLQAGDAAARVAQHLRERGVAPTGAAFGRFESEARWEVGYPVPSGTAAQPPFRAIELPAGPVASVSVTGPWGQESAARWARLLSWLGEHGYAAVGPPSETWSGDETRPDAQVTEMRIAVAPTRRLPREAGGR